MHCTALHPPLTLVDTDMDRRLAGESGRPPRNREIVSCRAVRAYVRARGAWSSEISAKSSGVLFRFSL